MMSAPAYTKGPWEACKDGNCSCGMVWSVPADFHVATAHKSWGDDPCYPDGAMTADERKANARLIAAAPDMFEALQAAAKLFDRQSWDLDEREQAVCDQIDAALSKASSDDSRLTLNEGRGI